MMVGNREKTPIHRQVCIVYQYVRSNYDRTAVDCVRTAGDDAPGVAIGADDEQVVTTPE